MRHLGGVRTSAYELNVVLILIELSIGQVFKYGNEKLFLVMKIFFLKIDILNKL